MSFRQQPLINIETLTEEDLPWLKALSKEFILNRMPLANPVLFLKGLPVFEESLPRDLILRNLTYGGLYPEDQLSLYDQARLMTYDVPFEVLVRNISQDPTNAEVISFARRKFKTSLSYTNEDVVADLIFYHYPTIIPERWAKYFERYAMGEALRKSQDLSSKNSKELQDTLIYFFSQGVSNPSMSDLKSLIKTLSDLSYNYDRDRGTTYLTVLDTLFQNLKSKVQFYSKKFGVTVFEDVFYKGYWEPLLQMIVSFFDLTIADIKEFADVEFPLSDPKFLGLFETAGMFDGINYSTSNGVF